MTRKELLTAIAAELVRDDKQLARLKELEGSSNVEERADVAFDLASSLHDAWVAAFTVKRSCLRGSKRRKAA